MNFERNFICYDFIANSWTDLREIHYRDPLIFEQGHRLLFTTIIDVQLLGVSRLSRCNPDKFEVFLVSMSSCLSVLEIFIFYCFGSCLFLSLKTVSTVWGSRLAPVPRTSYDPVLRDDETHIFGELLKELGNIDFWLFKTSAYTFGLFGDLSVDVCVCNTSCILSSFTFPYFGCIGER